MLRMILKYIWNERKPNLYLFIELLLVSVIAWYMVDYLFVNYRLITRPLGFDISNCYQLHMGVVNEDSDAYDIEAGVPTINNVLDLLSKIEQLPEIESASVSEGTAPYCNNNSACDVSFVSDPSVSVNVRVRRVTPLFFYVFQICGLKGEAPSQMSTYFSEMDLSGSFGSANLFKDLRFTGELKYPDLSEYEGAEYTVNRDSLHYRTLNRFIAPIRLSEYRQAWEAGLYLPYERDDRPIDVGFLSTIDLSVRVKKDLNETSLNDTFDNIIGVYRVGNLMINEIESYDQIRDDATRFEQREIENNVIGLSFLMLNILLGLLGIFWFRCQQRRSEIALQMALGASKLQIFMNQLIEGMILLTVATIPAIIIDYFVCQYAMNQYFDGVYFSIDRFASTVGITYLLMLVMIAVGIGIPAWRAMQIEPAEALHEE